MIRPATLNDVPAITRIYNHAVVHTTATADWVPVADIVRERWLQERQAQGLPVVVTEIDSEVRGWGSLSLYNPRPGYQTTVENSVYIEPDWHGCGLGSRILAHLIEEARRLGKHAIIASLDGENVASAALHQKFGFVERGRFPELVRKFDRWIDVVHLQLML
jgi:phosphinothricin acetyltransferase